MGTEPGHIVYNGAMCSSDTTDIISAPAKAYAEATHPQFLEAPTEDYGPSHSSLEIYARTQEPAPPKAA